MNDAGQESLHPCTLPAGYTKNCIAKMDFRGYNLNVGKG